MTTFNRRRPAPKVRYSPKPDPITDALAGVGARWDRETGARIDTPPVPADPVRLLSLDPSSAALGWAVTASGGSHPKPEVMSSGVWHPSKAKAADPALAQLGEFIGRLAFRDLESLKGPAAVEVPEGGDRYRRDPKTGRMVKLGGLRQLIYAQAVGVCLEACRSAGLVVYPIGVSVWNHGGKKEFTKAYVSGPALGLSGVESDALDENRSDAIGIGLWWHHARTIYGADALLARLRAAKAAGG